MYYATDKRWLNARVTVVLVVLNIVVFAADFLSRGALKAAGLLDLTALFERGEWYRLITACFLHSDIRHLFGNMLMLLYIGAVVERNLRPLKYTVLYFSAGLFGNILTVIIERMRHELWTSLGASGAVFGVLAAMLVLVIRGRAQVRRSGSSLLRRLLFVVAYSLFLGFASEGINNIAHVGGFLCGILMCVPMSRRLSYIRLEALL